MRHPGREDEEFEAVRVKLLGGFSVSVGSRTVEERQWRLKKAAALVKLLALAPGHRLHRDQVMETLWPELGPRATTNNLYRTLHAARRILEPGPGSAGNRYLPLEEGQIALCPSEQLWVDVEAFEDAAAAARRSREPAAYRAALDLYAGDLLPEDLYESWAEAGRQELRSLRIDLLIELALLCEERGEYEAAIEALKKAVASEQTNEEAHVGLMRLYSVSGRDHLALRQYRRLENVLRSELGAKPSVESERLYREIKVGRAAPARPPPVDRPPLERAGARRHNLPTSRTSFVGRERELTEVKRVLAMTGLLTLTGTGGCGKTRLALEVARDLVGLYPDGVWLVELAPLSEGELVPQAVARVLGVREQPGQSLVSTLVSALSRQKALLVLDNCEHLVESAARLVDALLGSCPGLRVLATSREVLGARGEVAWMVPPLSLPDAGHPSTVEELAGYESARLFVQRALYRPSAFVLAPENAEAVAEICRKLDGIPLAIELAAARVGALAVDRISERLDDSLKLLTTGGRTVPPRQQTLRGALDWSYDLLSEPERQLFHRLAVFAGGWTLESAEAVGAGGLVEEADVLDLLSRLVDKSLVLAEPGREGDLRYRFLEPVRQYAREKLEESGEAETVRRRHAAFFVALAEEAEPELKGLRQAVWVERLEQEFDNLRAAMRWLLDRDEIEGAVRLDYSLWLFWLMHGHQSEERRWAEEALAKSGDLPAGIRAKAIRARASASYGLESPELTARLLEEAAVLFREAGDRDGLALALGGGGAATLPLDVERAIALIEEGHKLWQELGDRWGVSMVFAHLGIAYLMKGDHAQAARHFEEALALSKEVGNRFASYVSLYNWALVAQAEGDYDRATELYVEGLRLSEEVSDRANTAYCLEGLAGLAGVQENFERSARLFGAAEALLEPIGAPLYAHAHDRTLYERIVDAVRSQLAEEAFIAAWAEGREMSPEEALEYALSEETVLAPQSSPASNSEVLTPREREVAEQVARGLTNRQVATELSISERTVHTHVRRILRKLGLASRAQITAWVIENRSSQDHG